ncbi:hypothetical protein [Spirosoma utsteinense]|uniref:Uncharacterized protein n=1 Tax=Spirosoma utsteinense TaxID=2585773 RepID=A0ABR6W2T6_9BACT|nr:hypothetical protein [Spirosoma utsteinense]MBC3790757.1 hypothetical protein [Spirosoma utsteinense]
MWRHWMDELLNTISGNSRYIHYPARIQWLALLVILSLISIPILLYWLT